MSALKRRNLLCLVALASVLLIFGTGIDVAKANSSSSVIEKYEDIRQFTKDIGGKQKNVSKMNLTNAGDILWTLTFNEKTKWPGKDKMPANTDPKKIMEEAMNPGLGIKDLHKQGITGKGVIAAIIDQPLFEDHSEFKGKIIKYKDFNCNSKSSMHGPAVTSLLVGKKIGTAPGANLYYAAVPSWLADASYYAKALNWIVAENKALPDHGKIRVVSVSAAPSGFGSPFTKNNSMWDEAVVKAEKAGILVLDCTSDHGIVGSCFYEPGGRDEISKYIPGFPGIPWSPGTQKIICAPSSPRTTAEEYTKGDITYQYTGRGGLSWSIPYCAGVFALGWQINPDLTPSEAVDLMFQSAYKTADSSSIIDPKSFIEAVKKSK